MRKEEREVWIADDGTVFDSKNACESHEAEILKHQQALAGLKVYSVSHGFDSTEGRGYFAQTLIVTDASQAVLIQWCLDHFGPPLSGWYGDGYYEEWTITRQDAGRDAMWALGLKGNVASYGRSPTKLVVVSQKDWTWAGLPASEFPWPIRSSK